MSERLQTVSAAHLAELLLLGPHHLPFEVSSPMKAPSLLRPAPQHPIAFHVNARVPESLRLTSSSCPLVTFQMPSHQLADCVSATQALRQ
ncbi:hypothetical protein HHUSO_G22821 [Huso huso]|uniref:Uncharacterized protein n=1 Tax=Huso huso TaxID=61971 RepID=A0ABR0YV67_HUSHU